MYAIRHRAAINAWCWRVNFRRRGKPYNKTFFYAACGGSGKALAKAIAWRDRQLAQAKILTFREFHEQKRSNNTSGVPGVSFLKTVTQPTGVWQARMKPAASGKVLTKTFSIKKYGNKSAFTLAVAARREMLARLDDRPYLKSATAKKLATRLSDSKR